jgi:hypothetical protein
MDYNEGFGLFVALKQKPMYSDQFTGREKSMGGKLAYEICKTAKLADNVSWNDFKFRNERNLLEPNRSNHFSRHIGAVKFAGVL